ncbi:uncharacterized protein KQ657_000370 [Scheffersomyces spartinae]|uniref:Ribosome biogenesis protein NOP53 n=1 Tax=Scheffersomyces spartinae TaxID=45513 RepID=A0A9P7V9B3_9ASCO|nr:uncharacterized protein KQ657_000370 [Scheffersomyces spartinae]KAG7193683.1 hypothetical protein KQ657_000370 [Scheffersomyces spartinae]
MSAIGRPQTKSQSSRKGKKAWRKNIDLEDVEKGIESARERQISLGEQANDDGELDFVIDTSGDGGIISKENAKLKRKVNGADRPVKKLKSTEILTTNKSKIPALQVERNNKRVSKAEVKRLMDLSGRTNGESKILSKLESDGLFNASSVDLWNEKNEDTNSHKAILHKKYVQKGHSISEFSKASKAPKTLSEKPIGLLSRETEEGIVDAGKSYNPSLESWKNLIAKEFGTEKEKETKRQELIDFMNHIQDLIATLDDNEEAESDDDEEDDEATNDEDQKQQEQEETNDYKLSINEPTKLKIKTKTKRNREQRHRKRMELEAELKELKTQIKELSKVEQYTAEVTAKEEKLQQQVKKTVKKSKLFKYDSLEKPLDVKLSHELTSNLKNLKSEGNLFYDQMRKIQQSGKVETRIPVAKKKKYTPKVTEKWTYKDFK